MAGGYVAVHADNRRKDSARGCVVCAPRFRGIIFKRLIIRHSEITLLHDNYIGAVGYVRTIWPRANARMSFHARLTLMDIFSILRRVIDYSDLHYTTNFVFPPFLLCATHTSPLSTNLCITVASCLRMLLHISCSAHAHSHQHTYVRSVDVIIIIQRHYDVEIYKIEQHIKCEVVKNRLGNHSLKTDSLTRQSSSSEESERTVFSLIFDIFLDVASHRSKLPRNILYHSLETVDNLRVKWYIIR